MGRTKEYAETKEHRCEICKREILETERYEDGNSNFIAKAGLCRRCYNKERKKKLIGSWVYIYFKNDKAKYIGETTDIRQRTSSHLYKERNKHLKFKSPIDFIKTKYELLIFDISDFVGAEDNEQRLYIENELIKYYKLDIEQKTSKLNINDKEKIQLDSIVNKINSITKDCFRLNNATTYKIEKDRIYISWDSPIFKVNIEK